VEDRKTGVETTLITVTAVGTLASAVAFLKDVAELPHLARAGNAAVYPVGSSRKGLDKDRVNVRVPVELMILPQQRIVGKIAERDLVHPEVFVRHQGRDYARIWSGQPFAEYVPPKPLKADAKRSVNVEKGHAVTLEGSATGGDGEYSFRWEPAEWLSDPNVARPAVDTSTPVANKAYTLTLTDGSGNTDTVTVMVTIRDPQPALAQPLPTKPEPPAPPPGPKRWPDGSQTWLRMALLRTVGLERLDEFMVHNNRTRQNSFYKVGDEFDGGQLVFVHQRGGVVRRNDEYFVYPIGANMDQFVEAKAADEYPELKDAAERHREAYQAAQEPRELSLPGDAGARAPVEKPPVPIESASAPAVPQPPAQHAPLQPGIGDALPPPLGRPESSAEAEKAEPDPVGGQATQPTTGRPKGSSRTRSSGRDKTR
jgi:hypothetical protein